LYRSAKGVEPMPAGVELARYARQMLDLAHRADVALGDYAAGAKGRIRMEANTSAITQFLPMDLAAFTERFADVKVEIEESRSRDIARSLREGRTDVGIVMDGTPMEGLECFHYRSDRLVAVVPRGHAVRGRSVVFASILDYDLVGLDSSAAMMQLLQQAAHAAGKPLRLRMQVRSFEALCKLVQAGMGIGILPHAAARNFAQPMGLRLLRLHEPWAERRMYVCVRDLRSASLAAKRLVEQLVQIETLRKLRRGL
jgi:DNA-binding transcriptional LysR family regulator